MSHDRDAEIRFRAYELWEQAGRPPGQHLTYWTAAEREYAARHGAGKRLASVKETGEEIPQEEWERFEAADKKPGKP